MMKSSSPVDGNVALVTIQSCSTFHAAASANAAKVKQTIKDRAVIPDVELALLPHMGIHVLGRDFLEKIDVFVGVKLGHLHEGARFGAL